MFVKAGLGWEMHGERVELVYSVPWISMLEKTVDRWRSKAGWENGLDLLKVLAGWVNELNMICLSAALDNA